MKDDEFCEVVVRVGTAKKGGFCGLYVKDVADVCRKEVEVRGKDETIFHQE